MNRDELIAEVTGREYRPNFWSAYDQGRLAALDGLPRNDPFHIAGGVSSYEWLRGYDEVAAVSAGAQKERT